VGTGNWEGILQNVPHSCPRGAKKGKGKKKPTGEKKGNTPTLSGPFGQGAGGGRKGKTTGGGVRSIKVSRCVWGKTLDRSGPTEQGGEITTGDFTIYLKWRQDAEKRRVGTGAHQRNHDFKMAVSTYQRRGGSAGKPQRRKGRKVWVTATSGGRLARSNAGKFLRNPVGQNGLIGERNQGWRGGR